MDELLYLIALLVGLIGIWSIRNYSKRKQFASINKQKRDEKE
jgi:hypothetical protein